MNPRHVAESYVGACEQSARFRKDWTLTSTTPAAWSRSSSYLEYPLREDPSAVDCLQILGMYVRYNTAHGSKADYPCTSWAVA